MFYRVEILRNIATQRSECVPITDKRQKIFAPYAKMVQLLYYDNTINFETYSSPCKQILGRSE